MDRTANCGVANVGFSGGAVRHPLKAVVEALIKVGFPVLCRPRGPLFQKGLVE